MLKWICDCGEDLVLCASCVEMDYSEPGRVCPRCDRKHAVNGEVQPVCDGCADEIEDWERSFPAYEMDPDGAVFADMGW